MNKITLAIIFGVFIVGMFSLAIAVVQDEDKVKNAKTLGNIMGNKTLGKGTVNNTAFGQCVSEAAVVKNTCYRTVKDTRTTCMADAKNSTDSKTASTTCRNTFKTDLKQCKMDFKSKKTECQKIKHNFIGSAKAAFK